MITKNDTLLLLKQIKDSGVDTNAITRKAVMSPDVNFEVVDFINQHRPFDLGKFYEKLRRSYNKKRSKLYANIVKEIEDPSDVLTTLASLNLQILLFSKEVENVHLFYQSARLTEINWALLNYSKEFDIIPCLKLLRLIKADLKAFEYMNRKDKTDNSEIGN